MAYKQELWQEAKKRCRLGDEEIRPDQNVPGPKESWKAPVKYWIRDMYEERQLKAAQKSRKRRKEVSFFFQNFKTWN